MREQKLSNEKIVQEIFSVVRLQGMTSKVAASRICRLYAIFDLDLLAFRNLLEVWWTDRSTPASDQLRKQISVWSTKPDLDTWALYLEGLERHVASLLPTQDHWGSHEGVSVITPKAWTTQHEHNPTQYFAEVSQRLQVPFHTTPPMDDYVFVAFKHLPAGSESTLGTFI
jgi:hypothetical protein